jgi:hypothetical protein
MTEMERVYCMVRAESLYETDTDMRRVTTGIRSEKCVVRRFRCRANVIGCTYYANLDIRV